jgi:transposase
VLLYQDETHVRAYQSLHATWSEVGKQKQVPTYGHHASVTLFGALNVMTGEIVHQTSSSCKQEDFLSFLQLVTNHYKEKLIAMVVDNAKIHRSQLIQDFLDKNERIMLIYLPPYSPNLNPIERLWRWLKETVISNRFHPTRSSIEETMNSFLTEISKSPNDVLRRLGIA